MIKEEFYFDSRDGENRIHAVRYTPDDGNVRGIVQIVHGMAEYVERYENLAEFLTKRGILVTGEDHLGHGKSVSEGGSFGYFCEQDPATVVVRDVHRLKKITEVTALPRQQGPLPQERPKIARPEFANALLPRKGPSDHFHSTPPLP